MNDCDRLTVGNFYFLSVNAWPSWIGADGNYLKPTGRHGEVTLFGFEDIPGGMDLYLTDRAWSDHTQSFVTNSVEGDGIVTIRSPSDRGFPAGLAFGMRNLNSNAVDGEAFDYDWKDVGVTDDSSISSNSSINSNNNNTYFQLGEDGDQIFFYCLGGDGRDRPLAAFSYNGPFLNNPGPEFDYGTNTSSAPDYFFRKPPVEVLNTTALTPGLLVMRTPQEDTTHGKIFSNWEFLVPSAATGGNTMDLYDLRNDLSDAIHHWIGKNPDGTTSYPPGQSASASACLVCALWRSPVWWPVWLLVVMMV